MTTSLQERTETEALQIWRFAYWYANLAQSAEYPESLDLEEWAETSEPVRRRLAALFRKHHIHDLSLLPMKEAFQVASEWLAAGTFDAKAARRIESENDEILTRMTRPMVRAMKETIIAEDMNGVPDVLAAIGNTSALMSLMLSWKGNDKLNNIDWLHMAGTYAYWASDEIAKPFGAPPAF